MTKPDFCEDRADWLVDAIACSTQDRAFLRGDMGANPVLIEAVYLNGLKALRAAYNAGLERAAEIADKRAKWCRTAGTRWQGQLEGCAAAIRAEKENAP